MKITNRITGAVILDTGNDPLDLTTIKDWVASTAYEADELFKFRTPNTSAQDIDGGDISADQLYIGSYRVAKTSHTSLTNAEISLIEATAHSESASSADLTQEVTDRVAADALDEKLTNKTTVIRADGVADDTAYPSEKAVRDALNNLSGDFVGLTDTPNDLTGLALRILRVNAAADAVEAVQLAAVLSSYDNTVTNLPGTPTEVQGAIMALKSLLDNQPLQDDVPTFGDLPDPTTVANDSIIHVVDASGDGTVTAGWAKYQDINDTWFKYLSQEQLEAAAIALTPAQLADITDETEGTVNPKKLFDREQTLKGVAANAQMANADYEVSKTWDAKTLVEISRAQAIHVDDFGIANATQVEPGQFIIVGKGGNYAGTWRNHGATPLVFATNSLNFTKISENTKVYAYPNTAGATGITFNPNAVVMAGGGGGIFISVASGPEVFNGVEDANFSRIDEPSGAVISQIVQGPVVGIFDHDAVAEGARKNFYFRASATNAFIRVQNTNTIGLIDDSNEYVGTGYNQNPAGAQEDIAVQVPSIYQVDKQESGHILIRKIPLPVEFAQFSSTEHYKAFDENVGDITVADTDVLLGNAPRLKGSHVTTSVGAGDGISLLTGDYTLTIWTKNRTTDIMNIGMVETGQVVHRILNLNAGSLMPSLAAADAGEASISLVSNVDYGSEGTKTVLLLRAPVNMPFRFGAYAVDGTAAWEADMTWQFEKGASETTVDLIDINQAFNSSNPALNQGYVNSGTPYYAPNISVPLLAGIANVDLEISQVTVSLENGTRVGGTIEILNAADVVIKTYQINERTWDAASTYYSDASFSFTVPTDGTYKIRFQTPGGLGAGNRTSGGGTITGTVQNINGALSAQGEQGIQGIQGIQGVQGLDGENGWMPVLGIASDGNRRVIEVTDWAGGTGTKPTDLGYITAAGGIDADIANGADVRGPSGGVAEYHDVLADSQNSPKDTFVPSVTGSYKALTSIAYFTVSNYGFLIGTTDNGIDIVNGTGSGAGNVGRISASQYNRKFGPFTLTAGVTYHIGFWNGGGAASRDLRVDIVPA